MSANAGNAVYRSMKIAANNVWHDIRSISPTPLSSSILYRREYHDHGVYPVVD